MEWLEAFLENWVLDSAGHFWLAALAGCLAFWLTQITLFVPLFYISQLRQSPTPRAVIYGTLLLCLLLSFCFVLISHAALDGFLSWWYTPLGPPLNSGV